MVSVITTLLSFIAFLLSLGVSKVYKSNWIPRKQDYKDYLKHGIFVGVLLTGLNLFYWKVLHRLVKLFTGDQSDIALQMIEVGLYIDLIFVIGLTWILWCHLKAIHLLLPVDERKEYNVIEMIWHPRKIKNCFKQMLK